MKRIYSLNDMYIYGQTVDDKQIKFCAFASCEEHLQDSCWTSRVISTTAGWTAPRHSNQGLVLAQD